jgi:autotransporter-associated beta strand protein
LFCLFTIGFSVTSRASLVVLEFNAGFAGNPTVALSPALSGWTQGLPSNDTNNFASEPVSPDGSTGYNAWRMRDNSTAASQFITWTHSVASSNHTAASAQGWTLAARLRVLDPVPGNTGTRTVVCIYGNGAKRWGWFFDVDTNGVLVASFVDGGTTIPLPQLDPAAHHEHQLIYNPASSVADYFINGELIYSGYAGAANSFNGVQWGTGSTSGRGEGLWNQIAFVVNDAAISNTAPVVTLHPQSQVVPAGTNIMLHAAFSGDVTQVQWFKDTSPLAGATTTNLVFNYLSATNAGDYWCRAYNGANAFVSTATAALAVLQPGAGLVVSEFLADNESDLRDEDGQRHDWIELFNADTSPVSTAGWALTDNALSPALWALPTETIPPGGFRLVFASGKNRGTNGGEWHASFKLAKDTGYLALTRPDVSTASALQYSNQVADISLGRTAKQPAQTKLFAPSSPLSLNLDGRTAALPAVSFTPAPGMFTNNVAVNASNTSSGGVLRYTVNGAQPEFDSPAFPASLVLSNATSVRAAMIFPGDRFGATATAGYLRVATNLLTFTSPLPLVVLGNFGAGEVPGVSSRGPRGDGGDVVQVAAQPQVLTLLSSTNGAVTFASPVSHQGRAGLRRRGSSSFNFTVKSYRMTTWGERDDQGENAALLDLPAESDWVLYGPDASQFDQPLIHNSFSYELARQSGFNAPRHRFVELFIDADGDGQVSLADHKGLALLLETPKRDNDRVNFDHLSANGTQGGWMINVDRMDTLPPGSTLGILAPRHFHTAGPDQILQTPDDNPIGLSSNDDQPNFYHSFFNFESPGGWDINTAQRNVIQTAVRALDAALYAPSYTNATLGYAPHIDSRNWAHHLALHCFTKNQDAVVLSSYLYRETPATPLRWATIWDFDRGFNRNPTSGVATDRLTWAHDRLYYNRLVTDREFRQTYIDTWQDLRRGAFATSNLLALVDAQAAQITTNVAARSGVTASTWNSRLATLKTWLQTRATAMDALYLAPPVISPNGGSVQPALTATLTAAAGTIYFTTNGNDPRVFGGGIAPTAVAYTNPVPVTQAMMITARALSGTNWSGVTRAVFFWTSDGPRFLPGNTAPWNVNANWESNPAAFPNGAGQAATIGPPVSADRNVDLTAPVTIGQITFPQDGSTNRNRLRGELAGNTLTFSSGTTNPARIELRGTNTGFVEIEVVGRVTLNSDLELVVTNLAGDASFGALRLRRTWQGAGGLIKSGPGLASLTGGDKLFAGAVTINSGVLQVTENATPVNAAQVSVFPNGQLRLNSDLAPTYDFGGDIFLRGFGRGPEISIGSNLGKLGALRYEPGSDGNHATLLNAVELAAPADIHVAGQSNVLELTGVLRGAGALAKSGGAVLAITGDNATFTAPVTTSNGTVRLRGSIGSAISANAGTILDAAGASGGLSGTGQLLLDRTALTVPWAAGLNHALVFSQPGAPVLANVTSTGNPLLLCGSAPAPDSIVFYLDLPSPPVVTTRIQGGYLLPLAASWSNILSHPALNLYSPNPLGAHSFAGRNWSPLTNARLTRVPVSLATSAGTVSGRILEIRFDNAPLTFESWRAATFSAGDLANPSVSGAAATPFGDGVPNLFRYALGIGTNSAAGLLPVLRRSGNDFEFGFPYDPGRRNLRWIAEATTNITVWTGAEVLFDSNTSLAQPDAQGWLWLPENPHPNARFYRLRLELVGD